MTDELGFTTRALSAWKMVDDLAQRPTSPPIYQSATFAFDDMDEFAAVAQTKIEGGYLYSRWANPTVDAVGRVIASLEGADATACFSSGMAAIAGALMPFVRAGDHIVSSGQLYGGTHGLFATAIPRAGVDVTKVDVSDHDGIADAFRPTTKVLYCETIGNPTIDVADLEALAAIAHERGALFVVDATFTSPYLVRALEHGVDLVVHSATKYLSGHKDVTAGVVSGAKELIDQIRHLQIDTGAILGPFEAWLLARGLETLALRMDRTCASALAIARYLEGHPRVERVLYPGLAAHPQHELARALFADRYGGVLAFEVAGGMAAGRRTLERVRLASPAASLGGTKTLIVHPASVTHTQLSPEGLVRAGVTEGMVRLSVGIEDPEDLLADLDEALR